MDGVFQLLPPHGLDQSMSLAVLVGVLFLHAMTETYGWVFVGLVVPGYLASVICIAPQAAVAVSIEALLTYGLAAVLSNGLSITGVWSRFFGRDRFFLIVLASVFVRQTCELWLLPAGLRWIDESFGTTLLLDSQYSSIGLVLVPLTANVLWKVGLVKGGKQLAIPTLLTLAVLKLVLLPYTNLSYSSLALTFEDVALDFLGSPKAYIILLVTGYLASRFNLLYGWDYNGILVPSLLALTWFEPLRLLSTVGDCLLQFMVAKLVLSLPGIRSVNLEGPRKTTFVFLIAFLLKYAAGWGLMVPLPGLRVTDLFGFGYILPTLLAVKMLQKKTIGRVLLPALMSSFLGFAAASVIGFFLDLWVPPLPPPPSVLTANLVPVPTAVLLRDAEAVTALASTRTRRDATGSAPLEVMFGARARYAALWASLDRWLDDGQDRIPFDLRGQLAPLGLSLRRIDIALQERPTYALFDASEPLSERKGWDIAVLRVGAAGSVLEVPRPWSERAASEASADLCATIDCSVILLSGADTALSGVTSGDATHSESSAFSIAHAALSERTIVQLRVAPPGRGAELFMRTEVPDAVSQMLAWAGASAVGWRMPPETPLQWNALQRFALLSVPEARLHERALSDQPAVADLPDLEATLQARYAVQDDRGTEYALSESELVYLGEEVVPRWLEAAVSPQEHAQELAQLATENLGLKAYRLPSDHAWLVIDPGDARGGLSMLIREGRAREIALAVPRPQRELGTWEIGLAWWRESQARLLLIGGAPSSSDPASLQGSSQVPIAIRAAYLGMQRHARQDPGAAVLVVRGLAAWRALPDDVIIGLRRQLLFDEHEPTALRELLSPTGGLSSVGAETRIVDGSPELVGLGGEHDPIVRLADTLGGRAAVLWVASRVRDRYRMRTPEEVSESYPFLTGTRSAASAADLLLANLRAPVGLPPEPLSKQVAALELRLRRYSVSHNMHALRTLCAAVSSKGGTVTPYHEAGTNLPMLLAELRSGEHVVRALALDLAGDGRIEVNVGGARTRGELERALQKRVPVLITHGSPARGPSP